MCDYIVYKCMYAGVITFMYGVCAGTCVLEVKGACSLLLRRIQVTDLKQVPLLTPPSHPPHDPLFECFICPTPQQYRGRQSFVGLCGDDGTSFSPVSWIAS